MVSQVLTGQKIASKEILQFSQLVSSSVGIVCELYSALQENVKTSYIHGSIYLTTSPALISAVSDLYYGPEFFLERKQSFVLYSSLYKDSSNSLSPENFISPLPGSVWLWFLISISYGAVFVYGALKRSC